MKLWSQIVPALCKATKDEEVYRAFAAGMYPWNAGYATRLFNALMEYNNEQQ